MRRIISPEVEDRICELALKGHSIRTISKLTGASKTTCHKKIKARLGEESEAIRQGLFLILKEYLGNPQITQRQKAEIRRWMHANRDKIAEADMAHATRLLTRKKEFVLSQEECGSRGDWAAHFAEMPAYVAV